MNQGVWSNHCIETNAGTIMSITISFHCSFSKKKFMNVCDYAIIDAIKNESTTFIEIDGDFNFAKWSDEIMATIYRIIN